MKFRIISSLLLFIVSTSVLFAFDAIEYKGLNQPYFSNSDYEVWIKSILNEPDYLFVNITLKPKISFRHPTYYKLKKNDRIDLLSPKTLKVISYDENGNQKIHPYIGYDKRGAGHYGQPALYYGQEYSTNLDKNQFYDITLIFRDGILTPSNRISLIQDNENRYFNFYDIPVSFPFHDEWIRKRTKEDLIKLAESSPEPVCGIYLWNL